MTPNDSSVYLPQARIPSSFAVCTLPIRRSVWCPRKLPSQGTPSRVANCHNSVSCSFPAQDLLQEHTLNSVAITYSLLQCEAVACPSVSRGLIRRQVYPDLAFWSTLNWLCPPFLSEQSQVVHSWEECHRNNVAFSVQQVRKHESTMSYLKRLNMIPCQIGTFQGSPLCQNLPWK